MTTKNDSKQSTKKSTAAGSASSPALNYPVLGANGKEVGSIDLDPALFGATIIDSIVLDTVLWQLAKRRQGTHSVLTKGVMRGGNRKPWKQKGTGRARAGSNTSPLWVGGAVAHGPKSNPFGYEPRTAKRSRRQALASALTDKVNNKEIVIVDSLSVPSGKSKDMRQLLKNLGVEGKKIGLLVASDMVKPSGRNAQSPEVKAARNLPEVELFPVNGINVHALLKAQVLVGDKAQFVALQEELRVRNSTKSVSK